MSIQYDFKGKVVLITGSSSGIGAGTALLFAKSGADLVITGRNAENLSKVAEDCRKLTSRVLPVVGDVTKEEDIKRLVEETINEFGKLDILVNNVGTFGMVAIDDPDYMEATHKIFDTNLNSVLLLTHLCVGYLAKTKGNVVIISSVAGKIAVSLRGKGSQKLFFI